MFHSSRMLNIRHLFSGGIITNYSCTSRCGHCLYACSPNREKKYIDREILTDIISKIKSLGCHSIHIGGGEPFLNLDGLKMVMKVAHEMKIDIEYVETNSSWYKDMDSACSILTSLKELGLSTLLISISPFHNEHIPFYKVKGAIQACRHTGMGVFPWISDFYKEIDAFDSKIPHKMMEYQKKYGFDYLAKIPSRYWIHFGGRALKTFENVCEKRSHTDILSANRGGCHELQDVSHFHFDLFHNYIPGLCSGLTIRSDDLGKPISPDKYTIISTLFQSGINGFFRMASTEYDFQPSDGYISKCHLCFNIRRHLVLNRKVSSRELEPVAFYENI